MEQNSLLSEKLNKIYDALYDEADSIVKENNPCGWKSTKNKCRGVQLSAECMGMVKGSNNNTPQCCCDGCKFWNNGCTAEKPLTCKTWLCRIATFNAPSEVLTKLSDITQKILHYNFFVHRGDKTASMARAMEHWTKKQKELDEVLNA